MNKNSPLKMQVLPLDVIPHLPIFSDILDLYCQKRGANLMPRWKDFSFTEFKGWHPRIALSEREGDDLRFRLFGSVFVDLLAKDLTGELLIRSVVPEQRPVTEKHFKQLFGGPFIGLATGFLPVQDRDFMWFEVLDLPLAGDDGEISHFLHASGPVKKVSSDT